MTAFAATRPPIVEPIAYATGRPAAGDEHLPVTARRAVVGGCATARRGAIGYCTTARRAVLAMCTTVLVVTACTEADALASVDDLPDLGLERQFRVGSVADPEAGFSRIGPVVIGPDDRIYVAEAATPEIRVYGLDGERLAVIGGPGQGPGEFVRIAGMGFIGDTLWVSDYWNGRITLFSEGQVALTVPAPRVSVQVQPTSGSSSTGLARSAVTMLASRPRSDGRIEAAPVYGVGVTDSVSFAYPNLIFDRNGRVADTLGVRYVREPPTAVVVGEIGFSARQALVDWPLSPHVEDGAITVERPVAGSGATSTFTVTRVHADGDTAFAQAYRYVPRRVDDAYVDRIVTSHTQRQTEQHGAAAIEAALRSVLPPFHPPVSDVRPGDDGSVWLRREPIPDRGDRWLGIAPDGVARGHVEIPAGARIAWIDTDRLITVETDDLGVPWLSLYDFRR